MGKKSGLSKSLILKGLQCPKALYLTKSPPEFNFPEQSSPESLLREGVKVGELAQKLFPDGIEVPSDNLSMIEQVEYTERLINSGTKVIYEASFLFDNVFVKSDILVREGNLWHIYEVKMSTSVREVNLNDVAIQYYVLSNFKLPIAKIHLVHINNKYVRLGKIEVEELFDRKDVTKEVLLRQENLHTQISRLKLVLSSNEPSIDIGPQCDEPYPCEFIPYCWKDIPEDSIFSLTGRGINKFKFYKEGVVNLEDIPIDELNERQRFQAISTIEKRDTFDADAVRGFLSDLWYPLCYLDFETYVSAVPLYDKMGPYQQIPFQFSLHLQAGVDSDVEQSEYLARPGYDPRRELTEKLLQVIPRDACVLTYNKAFEMRILESLSDLFPDLSGEIELRIRNVRDLMIPFRNRDVYFWRMKGSYSIKSVLPSMVSDVSYDGLKIANGSAAMDAYHEMCAADSPAKEDEIRTALLEYCRLDTLAMVKIVEKLKTLLRQAE